MRQEAWSALKSLSIDPTITERRPTVGRRVRVIEGKKLGAVGTVQWHGQTQYTLRAYRYCDSMQAHMLDLMGRHGFRVKIRSDEGETFFLDAEKVCVL
jgi:hypothetical protein